MPDLSKRSTEAELMDDLDAPKMELRQNLHELEYVNKFLGGYSVVLDSLAELNLPAGSRISIMDMGCGGGDILRAISSWMKKQSLRGDLIGIDWNPIMTDYASELSRGYSDITFRTQNIFDETLINEKPDIVMCNLFCHHFEDRSLIELIRRITSIAGRAVIINDLHRHWLAYYSIKVITKLLSGSRMVQNDGPLSVARAFKRQDLVSILSEAGIGSNYRITWRWAFRWKVVIQKAKND